MVNGLATAIIIVGLAVGAYGGLMALLDRAPRLPELVGLAALEVVLLAQTVIALSKTFTGERRRPTRHFRRLPAHHGATAPVGGAVRLGRA